MNLRSFAVAATVSLAAFACAAQAAHLHHGRELVEVNPYTNGYIGRLYS